jgi:hypothetical protein
MKVQGVSEVKKKEKKEKEKGDSSATSLAHCWKVESRMLTQRKRKGKGKGNHATISPSREAYRDKLAEACNMNIRILASKNKSSTPVDPFPQDLVSSPAKPLRRIP